MDACAGPISAQLFQCHFKSSLPTLIFLCPNEVILVSRMYLDGLIRLMDLSIMSLSEYCADDGARWKLDLYFCMDLRITRTSCSDPWSSSSWSQITYDTSKWSLLSIYCIRKSQESRLFLRMNHQRILKWSCSAIDPSQSWWFGILRIPRPADHRINGKVPGSSGIRKGSGSSGQRRKGSG